MPAAQPDTPRATLPPPERIDAWRVVLLSLWAVASFGLVYGARALDQVVFGWPLNFWLAAQGIVLCFVAIVGAYAAIANRAERSSSRADQAHTAPS